MARSATAQRMMETLPHYYWGEPLIERIVQARANEVDRADALIDDLVAELAPGAATDRFGTLGAWETQLALPVRPSDATVAQRQAKVRAALLALNAGSAADVLGLLNAASAGPGVIVDRDTPGPLEDTLYVPYPSDTYTAGVIVAIARRRWPAHRRLWIEYEGGFLFDSTPFDEASA